MARPGMRALPRAANDPRRAGGFSLIELMIALVIGAVLTGIILRMTAGTLATYRSDEYLARLQENARYAIERIDFSARMAGFGGCSRVIRNQLNTASTDYRPALYDPTPVLSGWEFTGTGAGSSYAITTLDPSGVAVSQWSGPAGANLVSDLKDLVVPGTDVLVVKRADQLLGLGATGTTAANVTTINLSGANGINQNALVLIADCQGGDLFQNQSADNAATLARTTGGSPGNLSQNLSHQYDQSMEIYTYAVEVYYVGRGISGEPSLFRRSYYASGTGTIQNLEIAEGVENMQILYGEDLDGDLQADDYRTASAVANWDNVMAMRVALLLRTVETGRQENDTATYSLLGTTITPAAADARRHRRVFATTISLRNKVG